jgi:hypothetical protein
MTANLRRATPRMMAGFTSVVHHREGADSHYQNSSEGDQQGRPHSDLRLTPSFDQFPINSFRSGFPIILPVASKTDKAVQMCLQGP